MKLPIGFLLLTLLSSSISYSVQYNEPVRINTNAEINKKQKQLSELTKEKESVQSVIKELTTKVTEINQQLEQLNINNREIEAKISQKRSELNELNQRQKEQAQQLVPYSDRNSRDLQYSNQEVFGDRDQNSNVSEIDTEIQNSLTQEVAFTKQDIGELQGIDLDLDSNTIYHFIVGNTLYALVPQYSQSGKFSEFKDFLIGKLDQSKSQKSKLHFKINNSDAIEVIINPLRTTNNSAELIYLGVHKIGLNTVSQCCPSRTLKFEFMTKEKLKKMRSVKNRINN